MKINLLLTGTFLSLISFSVYAENKVSEALDTQVTSLDSGKSFKPRLKSALQSKVSQTKTTPRLLRKKPCSALRLKSLKKRMIRHKLAPSLISNEKNLHSRRQRLGTLQTRRKLIALKRLQNRKELHSRQKKVETKKLNIVHKTREKTLPDAKKDFVNNDSKIEQKIKTTSLTPTSDLKSQNSQGEKLDLVKETMKKTLPDVKQDVANNDSKILKERNVDSTYRNLMVQNYLKETIKKVNSNIISHNDLFNHLLEEFLNSVVKSPQYEANPKEFDQKIKKVKDIVIEEVNSDSVIDLDNRLDNLINSINSIENLSKDAQYIPFLDLAVHFLKETKTLLKDPAQFKYAKENSREQIIKILTKLHH